MNLDTMTAVYTALAAGLPGIPVTRAWPQTKPYLPGCTYQLASWSLEKDGSKKTEILVTLRVLQQSQGDQLSDKVVAALAPLGYALQHAQDAQEKDTGFFLRLLSLVRLQDIPAPPPPPEPPPPATTWLVNVFDTPNNKWVAADFPCKLSFVPASRKALVPASLSFSSGLLNLPAVGFVSPCIVTISSSEPLFYGNPFVDLLTNAFQAATEIRLSVRRLTPAPQSGMSFTSGLVTAFHRSVLGLHCEITMRLITGFQ